jgi:hypothetical protein
VDNSLVIALSSLQLVIESIENIDILDEANADRILTELAPAMDASLDDFKDRVDARIDFIEYLEVMKEKNKADAAYFQNKARVCTLLQEKIKEQTKALVEANPTVAFVGTRKKFKVQNNGGKASSEWKATLQDLKNIVDPTEIPLFPEDMVEEVKMFVLNKEKLEAFLIAGGVCEGVKLLPRGKHLRIV